jgi:predicted pyridoxine 5'-phosphate oxidase superfamily flavin-nucleotide-binding protein
MTTNYKDLTVTESVCRAQEHYYGTSLGAGNPLGRDTLTQEEIAFIQARDSFYIATVTESGWPYIQHRGGSPGFLRVLDPQTLAFADYRGNRQLLSTGNLAANSRVALFLMDYPQRERLKIVGHGKVEDALKYPEFLEHPGAISGKVERIFLIELVAFDWNCPKFITPRYTTEQIDQVVSPLKARIAQLETQLKIARENKLPTP